MRQNSLVAPGNENTVEFQPFGEMNGHEVYGLPSQVLLQGKIWEGKAGLLVKTGDSSALAAAIEAVLTDVQLRDELVKKCYERAKDFSWEKTARETLTVFNSL